MDEKIVFILGAGASCKSLPLGKEMFDRLDFFRSYLENKINSLSENKNIDLKPEDIDYVFNEIETITSERSNHSSIDSYAAMLYNRNEAIRLHRLKSILSLYFLFEQSNKNNFDNNEIENLSQNYIKNDDDDDDNNSRIFSQIDTRYHPWLQNLWMNNGETLPDNVSIISWNYDMQIELSHASTFQRKIENTADTLNIFPFPIRFQYNQQINEARPKIIKLNGTAGLNIGENKNDSFSWIDNPDFTFEQILLDYLEFLKKKFNRVIDSQPYYNFAWENEFQITSEARKFAQKEIDSATILVIIGYSFPRVNRLTDKELFSSLKNIKKVVIQDTERKFHNVQRRLKEYSSIGNNTEFDHEPELEEFYIPNEL